MTKQYLEDLMLYRKLDPINHRRGYKFPDIGSSIHIHSRNGIYMVYSVHGLTLTLTCKKWDTEFRSGFRKSKYMNVNVSDFKCYPGGRHRIFAPLAQLVRAFHS
jgi:hypothetical protein